MKRILLSVVSAFIMFTPVYLLSATTYAVDQTTKDTACSAIPGGCSSPSGAGNSGSTIQSNVKFVINIFSWIVGVTAIIFMILGGFRFVTSGGDSGKVSSARNTILYSLIGLVVVATAQITVSFVLSNAAKG